ncbi:unnamed protein product [Bursaphelenchus okinawaensis]|uniref:Peptidase A1 domain-containing protein n=1 Tax=Bursaphelenchus okinawaensis TaxID=465554 RepID=A0A811JT00_9BILA|nr:unnamed protein product [Bursaphelenchus okinawaensis]CAG9081497.1 unnamed protein product [Bursaphelenchus okinawaensis]
MDDIEVESSNNPRLRSFANWAQDSWNGKDTFEVDLYTIDDNLLIGNLTLGSPPTTVRVTFDTTTFTTWVTGYHCVYNNGVTCFAQMHKYDPTLSYTARYLNRTMELDYGDATAKGEYVQELMVFGNEMSSSFPMFCNIGVANRLDTFFRMVLLAWPCHLTIKPASFSFCHAQIFRQPVFTVWLNSVLNTPIDIVAGTITFGRIDKRHCTKVFGVAKVGGQPLWGVKIRNVTLNGYFIQRNINAILDMSSSHIFAPSEAMVKIRKVLKTNDTQRIPCKTYLKMILHVNHTELVMKNGNLMSVEDKKKYCSLDVRESVYDQDVWILGAVFFRRFCVVHNYLSHLVGFADHLE